MLETEENKTETPKKYKEHLQIAFVVIGIVSFTLGAIVNFYTIKRLRAK
jgi:hypothetical protein